MTTVIHYIGHGQRSKDIERLFEVLSEEALDAAFTAYGDWLDQPVWDHANWPAEWPLDGSGSEVHFNGNFAHYSMAFSVVTDDKELLERLRVAIDANTKMPAYLEQHQPPMSASMLRHYIDDLGLGTQPWQEAPPTSLVLEDGQDDDRITAVLRVDGQVLATMSCHRRALNRHLIQLARRRRTALGYQQKDIIGAMDGSERLTVMHALVEAWKVCAAVEHLRPLADRWAETCPECHGDGGFEQAGSAFARCRKCDGLPTAPLDTCELDALLGWVPRRTRGRAARRSLRR